MFVGGTDGTASARTGALGVEEGMIVGGGGKGDWVFCEVRRDVGCYGVDGGLGCWDERFIRCGTREGRPVRRKQAWSLRSSVNLSPFGSADSQSRSLYGVWFFVVVTSDIGNEIKRSLYGTRISGMGCLYAIAYSLPAFCRDAICLFFVNPDSSINDVQIVCKPTPACFLPSTKATGGVYSFLP